MGCCLSRCDDCEPSPYVADCPRLILVPRGSPAACVFENAGALAGGAAAPLTLASHPGMSVVGKSPCPKPLRMGLTQFEYVELGIGPADKAMVAVFSGNFLLRASDRRAFDVAFWRYEEGNSLSVLSEQTCPFKRRVESDPSRAGGGRDFRLNPDGTISPCAAPEFVLGVAPPRLVLVPPGSPRRCVFDNADALRAGKGSVPLTLANFPGVAIVPMYPHPRTIGEWSYLEVAAGPASAALCAHLEAPFIVSEVDNRVLDVAMWRYQEGEGISVVKGASQARTRLGGGGRDWVVNNGGTVSPAHATGFVLGLECELGTASAV